MNVDLIKDLASKHAHKLYFLIYMIIGLYVVVSMIGQYDSRFGLTQLAHFGDSEKSAQSDALLKAKRFIHSHSDGYSGQHYAKNALDPIGNAESVSTFQAHRIFFSWTAYILGFGKPNWILQAYCIQNFIFWLGSAWLLLRWFPPNDWQNVIRYAGILFSVGLLSSLQYAFLEGPSLFFILLAMRLLEGSHLWPAAIVLGFAGLGKETNLLAGGSFFEEEKQARGVSLMALTLVPLIGWTAWLILSYGNALAFWSQSTFLDFPLLGLAKALLENLKDAGETGFRMSFFVTLLLIGSVVFQGVYVIFFAPRNSAWRRVGIGFCILLGLASKEVWLDDQWAIYRLALPLLVSFNILFSREARLAPALVLINLSAVFGVSQFDFTRIQETTRLEGASGVVYDFERKTYRDLIFGQGWYQEEGDRERYWRWSSGSAWIEITNPNSQPIDAEFRFTAKTLDPREIGLSLNEAQIWKYTSSSGYSSQLNVPMTLAPGMNRLKIESPQMATRINPDPRALSFAIYDFRLIVSYD